MRPRIKADLLILIVLIFGVIGTGIYMFKMPGTSSELKGKPEAATRDYLHRLVHKLAGDIGERNFFQYENLQKAIEFIRSEWTEMGYQILEQEYVIKDKKFINLEVEIKGSKTPEEIIVIGAHYDSVMSSPGANDNGTGVASVLALSKAFVGSENELTLRFVLFANEEPPFFHTEEMGSFVYAKRSKERKENIAAMVSLETIGYYREEKGSQKYPFPLGLIYPSEANFIAFVSNIGYRKLLHQVLKSFRSHTKFPSEGVCLFSWVPGVDWSDHWSFWKQGFPAILVTDTAPYRYPHYHTAQDTPDKVDYDRFAIVVEGLQKVTSELVNRGR